MTTSRPVNATRDGGTIILAFNYDKQLVERVRNMYWSIWDQHNKQWRIPVSTQNIEMLWSLYYDGLLSQSPTALITPQEEIPASPNATIRAGTARKPYVVNTARYDERLNTRLRAIPSAYYSKDVHAWIFSDQAQIHLHKLISSGELADPDGLVHIEGIVVTFDTSTGQFQVLADDDRAQSAFDSYLGEQRDVVAGWQKNGIEVSFSDSFTEEMYRGALINPDEGLQPEGFAIELHPYQRHGVALGMERSGLLICDHAGLGKTAQAIGIGHQSLLNNDVNRVVAVVPAHLRTQWHDEIIKFTNIDPAQIVVIDGTKQQRAKQYERAKTATWMIVHYDILTRDIQLIQPLAKGAVLIGDEVHRIRNYKAKRTKAMLKLGKAAAKRVGLSATAVENSPDEWFQVLSAFCVPGSLGSNFLSFADRYMYKTQWGYQGAHNLDELHKRSQPHFLRRRKQDVASFLPPLRVQPYPLNPDAGYAKLLRRLHRDAAAEIAETDKMRKAAYAMANGADDVEEDEALAAVSSMTAVGMLRSVCTSPRLLYSSDAEAAQALIEAGLVPEVDGPKLDQVRTFAQEHRTAGTRVVVFTYFKTMANLIAERLTQDGVPWVLMTGDTSRQDRDEAVARFTNQDEDITVFIATDAAAEGLNLGRTCSTLINVDIPWSPGRLEQRANRIHRLDGTHPKYLVINMTLHGTLEEGILRRVENKVDLMDAIMGDTDGRKRTTGRQRHGNVWQDALSEL